MSAQNPILPPPVRVVAQGDICPEAVTIGPIPCPIFDSAIISLTADDTLVGFSFTGQRETTQADDQRAHDWIARLFDPREPVPIALYGTAFQRSVWSGLLDIPGGQTRSYGHLAAALGRPRASRAVGSALHANPIGWLVPCHRVITASGGLGGYAGGVARKKTLLHMEQVVAG